MPDMTLHYKHFPQRSVLFWRKLKSPRKNSRHGDVLIQIILTKRKAVYFDFNFLQLIFGCSSQSTKTISWKT